MNTGSNSSASLDPTFRQTTPDDCSRSSSQHAAFALFFACEGDVTFRTEAYGVKRHATSMSISQHSILETTHETSHEHLTSHPSTSSTAQRYTVQHEALTGSRGPTRMAALLTTDDCIYLLMLAVDSHNDVWAECACAARGTCA